MTGHCLTRRDVLRIATSAAATAASTGVAHGAGAAVEASATRPVFVHWNFFLPSIDNLPPDRDYYATQYLLPSGEGGRYRDVGGFIRERPLPRAPILSPDWALRDARADVRLMSEIGIDAVQMNILTADPSHPLWKCVLTMLDACVAEGQGTRVIPCLDCVSLGTQVGVDAVVRLLGPIMTHPGLYRTPAGDVYLSAFCAEQWTVPTWQAILAGLRKSGARISFFPVFLNVYDATPQHIALADLVGEWSGNSFASCQQNIDTAKLIRARGKPWCSPIWPQDFRPKDKWYSESSNTELFREGWKVAEQTDADAALIITWNDYSEHSEIKPSTGTQNAFFELARILIHAFKTGAIAQDGKDRLIYTHRIQMDDRKNYRRKQPAPFLLRTDSTFTNDVEVVTVLPAPAQVVIDTSAGHYERDAAAGLSAVRVPLAPGSIRFRLTRDGHTIIDTTSPFFVQTEGDYEDLLYRGGAVTAPSP